MFTIVEIETPTPPIHGVIMGIRTTTTVGVISLVGITVIMPRHCLNNVIRIHDMVPHPPFRPRRNIRVITTVIVLTITIVILESMEIITTVIVVTIILAEHKKL